jgi:uncharacterized protein with PQ loop repeat
MTKNKSSNVLGLALYIAASIALLTQIYLIFKEKKANQISLIFIGYSLLSSILWVIWMSRINKYVTIGAIIYASLLLSFLLIVIYYKLINRNYTYINVKNFV